MRRSIPLAFLGEVSELGDRRTGISLARFNERIAVWSDSLHKH